MNDFLDKHGYRIYEGATFVLIRHHSRSTGCVHTIFLSVVVSMTILSLFFFFTLGDPTLLLVSVLVSAAYLLELERRRRDVKKVRLDFEKEEFQVLKKGKARHFMFRQVIEVVCTSEHIGSYSSAHRRTTEEYKREINVLFQDGYVMTIFSMISDFAEPEPESEELVDWLDRIVKPERRLYS
ncbi:hypothetical protein BFP72_17640 [Reichenbachiella sp. 5M10]|uniref:hypothetical protein n=1 Tax=Reichenbachiella sp. 5M10 TaxID=1889772 RepID=UPI000C153C3C|nr:hypothetical protein [Reichenbachiella sp. 5M10]PIB37098.1 hypothetical protein BFP72_17640 [Reichenbachiella sp. 5M10]